MPVFNFKVKDDFFPQVFEGEIEADTKEKALDEISDWYAMELGTVSEALDIKIETE
ncbi:hypothetical protein [Sporosarcina sp. BP05]|uniref:hypothetical protein n=1 Tax=Sporosarcina sp. BP05 TaxID=2758726 RepID=UPI00164665AE|nr:hypothetical protein [Sporosarcina sp. BP05]